MTPDIFEQRAKELTPKDPFKSRLEQIDPFFQRAEKQEREDRGILAALERGGKAGVTGQVLGYEAPETPEDLSFLESIAQTSAEIVSDLPAIFPGGFLGGVAGTLGGPLGMAVGAGAGAFALPAAIKEAYKEYRDFQKQGNDLTFGEFLERAGRVGKETGKAAVIGGATGTVSRILPAIAKTGAGQKLLSMKYAPAVAKGAESVAEAATIAGTGAALEGRLPTQEEFTHNLATLWAAKLAHKAEAKVRASLAKPEIAKPAEVKSQELAKEPSPIESVPEIERPVKVSEYSLDTLEDIKENRPLSPAEEARYDELTKQEEKKPHTLVEEDIQSPQPVDKSWFDIASSFLPEGVKEKGRQVIEKLPEPLKKAGQWASSLRQTGRQKMFFTMLEDHIGKRNAKMVESQFKWREALEKAEKAEKFSKETLEEMMYYRQKTGNPFKEGDTYEKLSERLPKNAKKFVDEVIDSHFKESLKEWNENPATKDINPREGLEDIYLPGLYEYDPKKFAHAYEEFSKRFKTKNPFSNEKVFLNYLEAFKEAGFKPRYKNIVELMKAYDNIMLKSTANSELAKRVRDLEKLQGQKIIVNSTNEKDYALAKSLGYVPFDDVFLRRYVAGEKDGKPIWATTAAPALVDPDFASAFHGVFRKEAYRPDHPFWKAYDSLGDTLRFTRVSLSPFHFWSLFEHGVPALGLTAFNVKKWARQGKELRSNKEFMKDAVKYIKLEGEAEQNPFKKGESLIDVGLNLLPEKMLGVDISKGINKIQKGLRYLFDEFHPNLKAVSWKSYVDSEIGKRIKEGRPPSEAEVIKIKRDMGKLIDDMYGGQRWELQRGFNNPSTIKWLRRVIGYPDWTVSAIKQGINFFTPGLKGQAARRWWGKYGIFYFLTTGLIRYINSGFEQTDKKDKSISGVRWNPAKAKNNLLNVFKDDPSAWWKFPLPDIDVKIAGSIFNPGKDEKKRKLYAHFGKQALELKHWAENPFDELFAKSNPLLQIAYKQLMGSTPYKEKDFKVRGKYIGGEMQPWDATKPWTKERLLSRGTEMLADVSPFGLRALFDKGIAPFVASGFGAVPVSKGMSLEKSESYIEDAIKNKDMKSLNEIRKLLRENGYEEKSINAKITKIRNRLAKEKSR